MAINLALSLTLDGKDAFWDANNTGINLDITHLQFGSRNRLTTGEESYLNQPKQAVKIQNGSKIGPEQVRIMATMPGIENYNIAEIGLWSGDPGQPGSILVAYTSVRTGFIAQMVTGIDLVFTYDMVISTADIDRINIIKDTGQSSVLSLLAEHELDRGAHPYYVTTDTEQAVSGAKTFTDKAIFSGGLTGDLAGNAFTASKLAAAILIGGVSFDGSAAINLPGVNIAGNQNTSGSAATASKLAAARTISLTGDATGSLSFDGSANASAAVTLANTGIAAGTYKSVTIDAKGRATAGNDVVTGLVTAATAAGTANLATSNTNTFLNITEKVGAATASAGTSTQITGAGTVTVASDAAGKITITGAQAITGNAGTATKLQTTRAINGVNFDGSASITIYDSTKLPIAGGTITGNLTVKGDVATSGDFITGSKLIADNGYTPLMNGIILQWGTVDEINNQGENNRTVTFPIEFPNACLNASATRVTASPSGDNSDGGLALYQTTNATISVHYATYTSASSGSLRGFKWMALGY